MIDGGTKLAAISGAVAAMVTGVGAAAVVGIVAIILAAGEFLERYFNYLLTWYPNRGTKVVA